MLRAATKSAVVLNVEYILHVLSMNDDGWLEFELDLLSLNITFYFYSDALIFPLAKSIDKSISSEPRGLSHWTLSPAPDDRRK